MEVRQPLFRAISQAAQSIKIAGWSYILPLLTYSTRNFETKTGKLLGE